MEQTTDEHLLTVVDGRALILRPGDTLLVGVARHLSTAEADEFKAKLRERLPGLRDVVLITKITHLAAYRTEPADAAQQQD